MNKLLLPFLFFIIDYSVQAQNISIKGSVVDTFNKENLSNAVVALLQAKDSVLISFTRTDKEGNFAIKNPPRGNYLLMISYPSFADYMYTVNIKDSAGTGEDVGVIRMTLKAKLLEDVIVRQKIAAVRMKGDTVEYKADSFKVRDGASVEEMLRKLPGLTVDKDGKITAQGEKVEKVLVDGEEFFGDDPTVATKNIQANAIDKVQVFDKKSDQAAFTGIDDGTKTKTLNLTLKDDKKKGYFGKVELASDFRDRWNNNMMLNSFRAKRKLSVYGIMSSTGKTGLSWDENTKYGENNNMEYNEDGGFFFSYGGGDEFDNKGSFGGEGLPTSWTGGAQYSKKFDNDKQNFNSSYRYNKLNTAGGGNTISQSILPGNIFFSKESREAFSSKQRHSMNATYEYQLDSATSIKIKGNGYNGTVNNFTRYNNESLDNYKNMVQGLRTVSAIGDNRSYNGNILIRHRFKKAGRTISLNLDQQYKNTNTTGYLFSVNRFSDSMGLKNIDSIDQKKLNDITNEGYYSKIAYTEPIVKNLFLEISYGLRVSNSESKKLTYDESGAGKYENMNDSFSNSYKFNVLTNSGGMMWKYNGKKTTASLGGDIAYADYTQTDLLHNNKDLSYSFTNVFPRASFMYKFNSNSRFNISYNGTTRPPSVEQIQPVRDNSNPLNIAIGNPDLKQEFRHSFNINYNTYKVLKQRGYYTYAGFNTTTNSISTNETTIIKGDSAGTRKYQYVNLNGNYNGWGGGGYFIKLQKLDMNINLGININVNRINNIISTNNGTITSVNNRTDNNSYGINIGFYKNKEKKYDVNYRVEFAYNTSTSTVNKAAENNYYTHTHNIGGTLQLPFKFEINTNADANFRQKTTLFAENNNVILWNAYLGRKLFKNDKGMISIKVNDILDQNKGYNRYVSSNIVREDTYQTLRRYFLLSFTFNFSKNPAGTTTP